MTADWSRKFDEPISLPKGRQLVALKDAGTYITKLSKAEHWPIWTPSAGPQWRVRGLSARLPKRYGPSLKD
jgi:hypothetical protein